MFFKKKLKKKTIKSNKIINNSVLGEMEHIYRWWSTEKIAIIIFGKEYSVNYFAASDNEQTPPTKEQEKAFKAFLQNKEYHQKKAEEAIIDFMNLDSKYKIEDVIDITGLYLSMDGKCGLSLEIPEKYFDEINAFEILVEPYFGILIIPDVRIIESDDRFEEILG